MFNWFIFTISLLPLSLLAQDSTKFNAVYIEAGGVGTYGSVGYERFFYLTDNWNIAARAGISTLRVIDFNGKLNPDLIFPIGASVIYGQTHCAEFGIMNIITGVNEFDDNTVTRTWASNGALIFGYRFYAKRNPFFAKCFYSPMLIRYEQVIHWGGLGIGYRF